MERFQFQFVSQDATSRARRGTITTPHGVVQTPTFMPVGTRGSVKGVEVGLLEKTGSRIVLGNTYNLMLRPGAEIVRELGGLHEFTGWNAPMLTDSGGFQLFSLARLTKITEEGAVFRSHIDGRKIELTPEGSIAIQEALGADIIMAFDHVVELPNSRSVVADAMRRTVRWAARCQKARARDDQALFGIVQGGLEYDLRKECAERLAEMDFQGYAIGGLSVGEEPREMYDCIEAVEPFMPREKPRRRYVRLRYAVPKRTQRHGVHRRRTNETAQRALRTRSPTAGRKLSLSRVSTQSRVRAPSLRNRRNARAYFTHDSQHNVLSTSGRGGEARY